jgi:hypothetical protein
MGQTQRLLGEAALGSSYGTPAPGWGEPPGTRSRPGAPRDPETALGLAIRPAKVARGAIRSGLGRSGRALSCAREPMWGREGG